MDVRYSVVVQCVCSQSNRMIIQRFRNKVLRGIVNAPQYIRNDELHKDPEVDVVDNVIKKYAHIHQQRLQQCVNSEVLQLLDNAAIERRLKRTKPFELVQWSEKQSKNALTYASNHSVKLTTESKRDYHRISILQFLTVANYIRDK